MEWSLNFWGDILLKEQLFDLASLIKDNFPGKVSQNSKLVDNLEALSNRQNTWPAEIIRVYRQRKPHLYRAKTLLD